MIVIHRAIRVVPALHAFGPVLGPIARSVTFLLAAKDERLTMLENERGVVPRVFPGCVFKSVIVKDIAIVSMFFIVYCLLHKYIKYFTFSLDGQSVGMYDKYITLITRLLCY